MLDQVNHLMTVIQVDQIKRKKHSECMNSAGRNDPKPFINSQFEPSDQSLQTREGRISRCDTEAEKAFAGLVIYAIGAGIHSRLSYTR